jgi:ABC-type transporter Mla MlaB component
MTRPLALPSELTIYTVAENRLKWLSCLAAEAGAGQDGSFAVDAAAVQEVDAAGVQLLLALQRTLAARQQTLHLLGTGPALAAACRAMSAQGLVPDA